MDDTRSRALAKADLMEIPGWDSKSKEQSSIDRRTCHRTRPMGVLCLGLQRTGTLSLRAALYRLGYFDVYHMASLNLENPPDCNMWIEALNAKFYNTDGRKKPFTREDWDQLLGHCMAITDQPGATFAEDLMAAYPEAKVVLTVRDSSGAWLKSVKDTVHEVGRIVAPKAVREPTTGWNPIAILTKLLHPRNPMFELTGKVYSVMERAYGTPDDVRVYNDHNERIQRLAKDQGREVLVFNVKQGWEPLCKFLGKEVPERPFPRVNEAGELEAKVRSLRRTMVVLYTLNAVKLFGVPVAAIVLGYVFRHKWLRV